LTGTASTVSGGAFITITADYATASGGWGNVITGTQKCGITGDFGAIGGAGTGATIGGGVNNTAGGCWAVVSGGAANRADDTSTVGGGIGNQAASEATISGGFSNIAGYGSAIGGGSRNIVTGTRSTVGGGTYNQISADYATIAGGGPTEPGDLYPSGTSNHVTDDYGAIGGGGNNRAGNELGSTTDASYATVGGGKNNRASGQYSTIPGGYNNIASGIGSFAVGQNTTASHNGAFVWGDGTSSAYSTDTNQFLALASNGVGFYTSFGSCLFFSGSNWTCTSDRNLKENFIEMKPQEILAALVEIPITQWNMKGQDQSIYHVGPMAQDFYAAFVLGEDDEHINTGDEIGIAYAAIQGLNQINQGQADQIAELQAQNTDLERQNSQLDARLTALEQNSNEGSGAALSQTWLLFTGLLVGGFVWIQKNGINK
jgi:hypothetical protein